MCRGRPCQRCVSKGHPHLCSGLKPVLTALSPSKKRRRSADDVDQDGQQHRQHRRPPLPTATDQMARPADRRRGGSGDSTLALVGQALELLRAEVRSLRDENQRLRNQMTTMMTHQSTTSRILATLQQQREQQEREQQQREQEREREHQQHQRNRLHQPRPQSAQHLPPMALFRSSASSTMPAVALMEAMHEMPFLRDYPMLTGFAVPDFRYASPMTQRRGTTRHTHAHGDVAYVSGGQISGHCGRVRVGVRPSAANDHLRQHSHVPTE